MNRKITAVLAAAGVAVAGGTAAACGGTSHSQTSKKPDTTVSILKADGYHVIKTESGTALGGGSAAYIVQLSGGSQGNQGEGVVQFTNKGKAYESIVASVFQARANGALTITYRDHRKFLVFVGSLTALSNLGSL